MHEGITEDGRICDCKICGVTTHMLDPEEMNEVCDDCSLAGWGATKSVWKLTRGDVVHIGKRTAVVLSTEDFGKQTWLELRDATGEFAVVQRNATQVHVHMDKQDV
jgi:hypothetical protein